MTEYQNQGRVDLAILDALGRCAEPITFRALCSHVCAHSHWASDDAISRTLMQLVAEKHVVQSRHPAAKGGAPLFYNITQAGQVRLTAAEASPSHESFHKEHREEPLQVSMCDHSEPEVPDAAQALICIDEDELNDWWDALDVEAKADAFAQYSLANDGRNSHVYIEPTVAVPLKSPLGETSDDEAAALLRKHSKTLAKIVREAVERQAAKQ
jgi:hypothetical protein